MMRAAFRAALVRRGLSAITTNTIAGSPGTANVDITQIGSSIFWGRLTGEQLHEHRS
jgi:hypothetical protein